MDRDRFEIIRQLSTHFEDRRKRGEARLALDSSQKWCFAVLGLDPSTEEREFFTFAFLRRVDEPPGEVELARALKDKRLMSPIGRYSHSITHEIVIADKENPTPQWAADFAWWLVSAIRVRSRVEILIPAAANHSWSTISGAPPDSCDARLIEDVPSASRLGGPQPLTEEHFQWVEENILRFIQLLEDPRYRLAVEALTTYTHHANLRLSVAHVWAGIEALFGIKAELRFRVATYLAATLEPRGQARLDLYRSAKRLYDFRSQSVHGEAANRDEMISHLNDVTGLLSRLLCQFAEQAHVPQAAEYDSNVFVT